MLKRLTTEKQSKFRLVTCSRGGLLPLFQVLLICLVISSCTATSKGARRDFQVSVSSDGTKISNFSKSLVHRIPVSSSELERVFGQGPSQLRLPFAVSKLSDLRNNVRGLEVRESELNDLRTSFFSFKSGDILLAVGEHRLQSTKDLWHVYKLLKGKGMASVTLERDSSPHKVIYFLESGGGR